MQVRRGCQASQRKGRTSGETWATSGEVWGASGEVWETSGEPLDSCKVPQWENFRGSRRKTSEEVWGTSGEVRGLPRSSGEPDPLTATRQICFQFLNPKKERQGNKKEHKHKECGQKLPLPDSHGTPDPANSLCLGPLFPSKYRKKGLHKEFRGGGVLGARKSGQNQGTFDHDKGQKSAGHCLHWRLSIGFLLFLQYVCAI